MSPYSAGPASIHTIQSMIVNTLRPTQNGHHYAKNIFKCIFHKGTACILSKILLKFVSKGQIYYKSTLDQVMIDGLINQIQLCFQCNGLVMLSNKPLWFPWFNVNPNLHCLIASPGLTWDRLQAHLTLPGFPFSLCLCPPVPAMLVEHYRLGSGCWTCTILHLLVWTPSTWAKAGATQNECGWCFVKERPSAKKQTRASSEA